MRRVHDLSALDFHFSQPQIEKIESQARQGIFVKKTNEILPKGRNHSNQQCNYLVSSLGHQRENWPKEWFFHLLGQFYKTQLNYYLFSNFLLLLSDDDQWFSILLWLQKKSFKVLERNLTRNCKDQGLQVLSKL